MQAKSINGIHIHKTHVTSSGHIPRPPSMQFKKVTCSDMAITFPRKNDKIFISFDFVFFTFGLSSS